MSAPGWLEFVKSLYPTTLFLFSVLSLAWLLTSRYDHLKYLLLRLAVVAILLIPITTRSTPSFAQIAEMAGYEEVIGSETLEVEELQQQTISLPKTKVEMSVVSSWDTIVFAVWMVGCGCYLGYTIIGYLYIALFWRKKHQPAKAETIAHLQALQNSLAIRRRVELRVSCDNTEPCVVGIWSPCIVVPAFVVQSFSQSELRMFLLHELVHIRRNDQLILLLLRIVQALYFFHPLVWFLSRSLHSTMEVTCDAEVVARGENTRGYAHAIVRLLEMNSYRSNKFAIGYFSDIKARIRKLVSQDLVLQARPLRKYLVIILMVLIFATATIGWGYSPSDGLLLSVETPEKIWLYKQSAYTLTIANESQSDKRDIRVHYMFPQAVKYIKYEAPLATQLQESPRQVVWNIPILAAQSSTTIKVYISSRTGGQHRSIFTAKKVLALIETEFRGIAAIHASSYDTEDPISPGDNTIYVVEVRNEGTAPATNIELINIIPENAQFVAASGKSSFTVEDRQVSFAKIAILQPGEKLFYRFEVKALRAGAAVNKAYLRYDQFARTILDEEGTSVYE